MDDVATGMHPAVGDDSLVAGVTRCEITSILRLGLEVLKMIIVPRVSDSNRRDDASRHVANTFTNP